MVMIRDILMYMVGGLLSVLSYGYFTMKDRPFCCETELECPSNPAKKENPGLYSRDMLENMHDLNESAEFLNSSPEWFWRC